MALTCSEAEPDSDSGSEFKDDEVFSKLSHSNLIILIQYLISKCLEKAKHMEILKKQYDLLKEELKSVQNKNEVVERDHIALVKDVSDKIIDKNEIALQEFILTGLKRTKLASMIYGVIRSRGESLGYHQNPFNPRTATLIKPSDPSSSKSTEKRLDFILYMILTMQRL